MSDQEDIKESDDEVEEKDELPPSKTGEDPYWVDDYADDEDDKAELYGQGGNLYHDN